MTQQDAAPLPQTVRERLFTGDALEGTFLPLNLDHRKWTQDQWRSELADLYRLGFDTLVLQWSEYDGIGFVDDGGDGPSTVQRILSVADEIGLECYLGLSLRGSWWQTSQVTAEYLKTELTRNTGTADQLYSQIKGFRSFRGWYIPHEMTELNYSYDQREAIIGFYSALSDHLKHLDPLKLILASGYTDPQKSHLVHFVLRWADFVDRAGIDVLIFQDGAGVERGGSWRAILPFVEAIAILNEEFAGDVWLLAELFTQTNGPPLDDGSFKAEPADIDRLRDQIEALGRFKKKLIGFSYFDYMRPGASDKAAALSQAYRELLDNIIAQPASEAPD